MLRAYLIACITYDLQVEEYYIDDLDSGLVQALNQNNRSKSMIDVGIKMSEVTSVGGAYRKLNRSVWEFNIEFWG